MSAGQPMSIFQFNEMKDPDKAYMIRISGGLVFGIIAGIITGLMYSPKDNGVWTGRLGFALFFIQAFGLAYFTREKYDLHAWTTGKLLRHGLFISFLLFLFMWILIFNFVVVPKIN